MSRAQTKFNPLVIDPDLDRRMRLRSAITSVALFGATHQTANLNDGLHIINAEDEQCDVIFLSQLIPELDIQNFVQRAKVNAKSQDAAFVMVLKTQIHATQEVARYMMYGIDGFLFEPYSVDQLVEITKLTSQVKKQRIETRMKLAATLMVQDAMKQIDVVAHLKSCGYEASHSFKRLRQLQTSLKELVKNCWDGYTELVVKMVSDAPIPHIHSRISRYAGASYRVKKKLEAEFATEMEAQTTSAENDVASETGKKT